MSERADKSVYDLFKYVCYMGTSISKNYPIRFDESYEEKHSHY